MADKILTRREFLSGALVASAALSGACTRAPFHILPRHAAPGKPAHFVAPSNKVNLACVGCGGQGGTDVRGFAKLPDVNLVAFCDVDDRQAADTFKEFPNVPRFKDFRVMLDKMGSQIDAVTVSTPDHMHAPVAMRAMKMGKHVFVQKPLAHDIYEVRTLTETARQMGVATHMGIQGHSLEGIRMTKAWIDAGAIGTVREVYIFTNRPIWPQRIARPTAVQPVPAEVDWDLWLGSAPFRPYNEAYMPFKWRGWWDYGTGALGDMGCHGMDAPFHILNLDSPTRISAVCDENSPETGPLWTILTYEFAARGNRAPVKVYWFDGNVLPPRPADLEEDRKLPESGMIYVGDTGKIMAGIYCDGARIIPETKMKEVGKPKNAAPASIGHYNEFIQACKGGPKAGANFDFAGPLTEMVLLGNLAIRTGEPVEWDAKRMRVTNNRAANEFLRRDYREGFEV